MEENDSFNLDLEFKRYLQILRPYLGQLTDQNIISICNAWIQRLSDCSENEKVLRNKYVFALCYQLAKGVLEEPFMSFPQSSSLLVVPESMNSDDSSTEIECAVVNAEDSNTKVLFSNKQLQVSDTDYLSQSHCNEYVNTESQYDIHMKSSFGKSSSSRKRTVLCYDYPEILKNDTKLNDSGNIYECRAKNLIKKLREIKTENLNLHTELLYLKEESTMKRLDSSDSSDKIKVDNTTSPLIQSNQSDTTLKSLKFKLQEVQESRNSLIHKIASLQEQLDNLNDIKMHEIEECEAKYKLEIISIKSNIKDEIKDTYEKKIEDIKHNYELKIKEIENNSLIAIQDVKLSTDEKRFNKMERNNIKCTQVYEAKLAQLQREKHLAECSLQLQMVRQRAQVVNEVTDENQAELTTALDKLELKYKEIVANVQATAIQRRVQDQMTLETILQAACGIPHENMPHGTNKIFKTMHNQNHSYDSEISPLLHCNKANKSLEEESLGAGYCINAERMGELFERVYIPQRDNCEARK
ncbi:putative CCDC46 protein [Operophtera brumata]|uniref:Putative CCDC46 protein n=1 Tax=Operophtera brumata TaxID=104452 RepID=A0A0L7L0V4_OPEBR|nr:putative CCDC46 protein [Operophtera brumata]